MRCPKCGIQHTYTNAQKEYRCLGCNEKRPEGTDGVWTNAPNDLPPEVFVQWMEDFLSLIGDEGMTPAEVELLKHQHQGTMKAMKEKNAR